MTPKFHAQLSDPAACTELPDLETPQHVSIRTLTRQTAVYSCNLLNKGHSHTLPMGRQNYFAIHKPTKLKRSVTESVCQLVCLKFVRLKFVRPVLVTFIVQSF